MGCGNTKVTQEEIEHIQKKVGVDISEKDIRHWYSF